MDSILVLHKRICIIWVWICLIIFQLILVQARAWWNFLSYFCFKNWFLVLCFFSEGIKVYFAWFISISIYARLLSFGIIVYIIFLLLSLKECVNFWNFLKWLIKRVILLTVSLIKIILSISNTSSKSKWLFISFLFISVYIKFWIHIWINASARSYTWIQVNILNTKFLFATI